MGDQVVAEVGLVDMSAYHVEVHSDPPEER